MKFFTTVSRIFPRYFFLLFAVFFATGFFAFYESFRVYRAEAELIVVSQGSASPSGIAQTLSHIPETLAFYDRLRVDHSNVSDPWAGDSPVDRKLAWDRVIDSSSSDGSGIISLSVVGPDSEQADALLNASVETLYGFSGRLYNRDAEADIRLLEKSIVYPVVTNMWALVSLSAACAVLTALIVSLLFQHVSDLLNQSTFSEGREGAYIRSRRIFLKERKEKEKIRPVGSFLDISSAGKVVEQLDSLAEYSQSVSPNTSGGNTPRATSRDEVVERVQELAQKPEQPSMETYAGDDVNPLEEQERQMLKEYAVPKTNDEPEDIWEKQHFSLPDSAGKMRIGMKAFGEEQVIQSDHSNKAAANVEPDTSDVLKENEVIAASEAPESRPVVASEEIFQFSDVPSQSPKREQRSEESQTRESSPIKDVEHSNVPGNLVTVSAQDFTWEKFLFQNEKSDAKVSGDRAHDVALETQSTAASVSKPEVEKHEPTPEELKARLNQLLRGEL